MRHIYCWLLVTICCILSCTNAKDKDNPLLVKAPSIKQVDKLYRPLVEQNYEDFVEGIQSAHDKSEAYRNQLIDMMKQHTTETVKAHQGISNMTVVNVEQSTSNPLYAEAYIKMEYSDGTEGQILVPLVRENGKWWMK